MRNIFRSVYRGLLPDRCVSCCCSSRLVSTINAVVELIKRLQFGVFIEEDPALDPPWKSLRYLVVNKTLRRHAKDVVEFLEGPLLGFGDLSQISRSLLLSGRKELTKKKIMINAVTFNPA